MLDVNDVGFSCSNIAAIIMSLKVEHHEFQGPQRQKKRSNASFIMQKLRPKLYIYHKICSQHFEELLTVKFLEQRKYKNYSIQSICRAFSLPKRWGKKRGSFKIGIIFDWMESFLFCLCSKDLKYGSSSIFRNSMFSTLLFKKWIKFLLHSWFEKWTRPISKL